MQKPPFPFRPGDRVRVRGAVWRLAAAASFADCDLLQLDGLDEAVRGERAALLFPFDRPQPAARRIASVRPVRWRLARRALAALLADHAPWPALVAARAARIDLRPFQLEPALAMLTGRATRLLLADEVGLGKTIQAALIVAELAAREPTAAILIVTPAGLVSQWATELVARFGLAVSVMDAAAVARALGALPRGTNPWLLPGIRLVSIDFIKRMEVLQALEPAVWDLLVVDEVHGATSTSDRGAAVRALASRARRVVLVTATPHRGDEEEFGWLCRLGRLDEAGEAGQLAVFRRTRAESGLPRVRRVHLLRVTLSPEEQWMHRLLDRYVRRVWHEAGRRGDEGAQVAMAVLLKRALSSAGALAESAARRLAHLGAPAPRTQPALPFADDADEAEEGPDRPPDAVLAAPGLANSAHERAWLGALLAAALAASRRERKLAALARLVRRVGEPLVVFTEYRDTLGRLAAAIGRGAPEIVLLHGGLGSAERQAALAAFLHGPGRILLATDVAGEGLNLQERARLVVSVELPWRPLKLEQRIGRVDRIGQTRPVHAIHLVARGTAEEALLARLARLLAAIEARLGTGAPLFGPRPELAVAAAWIGGRPLEPAPDLAPGAPARAETVRIDCRAAAAAECDRLVWARRCAALAHGAVPGMAGDDAAPPAASAVAPCLAALDRTGPWIAALPPRRVRNRPLEQARRLRGLVALVRCRLADGAGRLAATELVALRVPGVAVPRRPRRRELSALIAGGPFLDELVRAAARYAAARLVAVEPAYRAAVHAAREREAALVRLATDALARTRRPVQPGLFEARALRLAHEAHWRAALRLDLCARRLERLERAAALELAGPPELVLVLLCP